MESGKEGRCSPLKKGGNGDEWDVREVTGLNGPHVFCWGRTADVQGEMVFALYVSSGERGGAMHGKTARIEMPHQFTRVAWFLQCLYISFTFLTIMRFLIYC